MDLPEELLAAVKSAARESKLSCKSAMELANQLGVPPYQIGRAADELGIKIAGCQLGCFR